MTDRLKAFMEHGVYLKACETHPSGAEIEHIAAYEHIRALEAFRDEVMKEVQRRGSHTERRFFQSIHAKHFPKEQSGHE